MKNIKRFAGASVGAMVASLAAIGISSAELQEFLDQDVRKIMAGNILIFLYFFPDQIPVTPRFLQWS